MFDPTKWANATTATNWQKYLDNTIPAAQLLQNQWQYGQDFGEQQRRWNADYGRAMQQFDYQKAQDAITQQFARDQMAQEARNAAMNVYGRQMPPRTQWVRNWG